MIESDLLEEISLHILDENYTYVDVMYEGKECTALEYNGKWYMCRINFKFGDGFHRGHAYLEMDSDTMWEISKEDLDRLPSWI